MSSLKVLLIAFIILINVFQSVEASSQCFELKYGINLAGPEFASKKQPGKLGHDYQFPTGVHLLYYKAKGFNSVRLPILWERLQSELYSDLDTAYLNEIQVFLKKAEQHELDVVLDLHNYGRYKGEIVGSQDIPNQAFYDVWKKIAQSLQSYPALLAYGLMNEPHDTKGLWFSVAQSGVDGIRSVDKDKNIYIAGEHWSNAHVWSRVNPKPFVVDPQNKIAYEAHIYFDKNFSGTYKNHGEIYKKEDVYRRLKSFVLWLKKYNLKGVIGEWGVPSDNPAWFPVVDEFTDLAKEHCLDWYYWRGGVWADKYHLSLEPIKAKDKPLMQFLSQKIKDHQN
ncbi:MAG: glycoside hydrolase family 5 protein [Pseudomonadota bacterium]|nr:glycoside hydrolase family 5 protein [Pseudomonadota bacterium]